VDALDYIRIVLACGCIAGIVECSRYLHAERREKDKRDGSRLHPNDPAMRRRGRDTD
jgi:hypothetical protein